MQKRNATVAVIGAGDYIGGEIAKKFAAEGFTVFAGRRDGAMQQADGEIFNTITYGKTLMGPYGPNIAIEDRWAIVAYVRALQRSHLASLDDVPADQREPLSRPLPPSATVPAPKTPAVTK